LGGGGWGWGVVVFLCAWCQQIAHARTRADSGWVGGSSVLKKWVRDRGELSPAKPLAIIA